MLGYPRPHSLQRELVAERTEAAGAGISHRCDHREMSPRLAAGGIGEVNLDDVALVRGQRVMDRPRIVRKGAGIDDDRRAPTACTLDRVDQFALVVRLCVLES